MALELLNYFLPFEILLEDFGIVFVEYAATKVLFKYLLFLEFSCNHYILLYMIKLVLDLFRL